MAFSNTLLFADDTKCSVLDSHNLQDELDSLANGFETLNLTFNDSKCVKLKLHSRKSKVSPTYSYNITNTEISEKSDHRELGVVISGIQARESNYNETTAKAYQILGLLCRTLCRSNSTRTK